MCVFSLLNFSYISFSLDLLYILSLIHYPQLGPGVTAIAVQVVLNGGTLSQNWGLLALQMAIFGPLSATQPVIGYSLFPPEVRRPLVHFMMCNPHDILSHRLICALHYLILDNLH